MPPPVAREEPGRPPPLGDGGCGLGEPERFLRGAQRISSRLFDRQNETAEIEATIRKMTIEIALARP